MAGVRLSFSQPQVVGPALGRFAPGLRVASHNAQGFTMGEEVHDLGRAGRIFDRIRYYHSLRLDVVALQETHLRPTCEAETQRQMTLASRALGRSPFTAFWAHASAVDSHAGVGILIRSDLLMRGQARVLESQVARSEDGRMIAVPLDWRGHKLLLVSVYVPAAQGIRDGRARQRNFLPALERFVRQHASPSRALVLLGDWNVTLDQQRERFNIRRQVPLEQPRLRSQAQGQPGGLVGRVAPRATDRGEREIADRLADMWAAWGLRDAFRSLHPGARVWTWSRQDAAALLDRILAPQALVRDFLHQCSVDPISPSDHRLVVMHLLPRAAAPGGGRGLPRYRVEFERDPDLLERFKVWVEHESALAPARDHGAFLGWWPGFKARLGEELRELNCLYNRARRAVPDAKKAAMQALRDAVEAFEGLPPDASLDEVQAKLQDALRCERECAAACREMGLTAASAARFTWLLSGERPGPLITALTQAPRDTGLLAALADPNGAVVTDPQAMANIAVHHFAAVSAQPHCDPAARARLIDSVRRNARRADALAVTQAAARDVALGEVQQACRKQRPTGRAGADGLPPGIWKLADGVLQPLLVTLFTAIGHTGRVPQAFLDGVVVVIHKRGSLTDIANYRPITLLNTEYRILARVLASRLGPILNKVIGPEQTAFLPGRHIGDSIRLLQLLPSALRAAHASGDSTLPSSGAIAFLDIKGAYDTVDRPFLYEVLGAVGVGPFVDAWVRVLLTDTRAVAMVNRAVSVSKRWEAGVRQGCPLSPPVYNAVPLAVACFLQDQQDIGLRVLGGASVVCDEFADDMRVFLRDATPAGVQPLANAMAVVKAGANQDFQLPKCAILPVGVGTPPAGAPGGPGTVSCGIPVKDKVESMGIVFSNGLEVGTLDQQAESGVDWDGILGGVRGCFARLAKLPLSAFGRAFAASSYGLSKAFYHAEFGGMPQRVAQELGAMAKRLVDRGLPPVLPRVQAGQDQDSDQDEAQDGARRQRRQPERAALPALKAAWLPGPPSGGAFGLIPFEQHVTARHALAGLRLVQHLAPRPPVLPGDPAREDSDQEEDEGGRDGEAHVVPWVVVAAAAIREAVPQPLPVVAFLTYVAWLRQPGVCVDDCPPFARRRLCAPLLRLAVAVAALGQPVRVDVAGRPVVPVVPMPVATDDDSDTDVSEVGGDHQALPFSLPPAVRLGPWVAHAPVFGNPYLGLEVGPARRARGGPVVDPGRMALASLSEVGTLADLRTAYRLAVPAPPAPVAAQVDAHRLSQELVDEQQRQDHLQRIIMFAGVVGVDLAARRAAIESLWLAVPREWRGALAAALPADGAQPQAQEALAGTRDGAVWRVWIGWGWRVPYAQDVVPWDRRPQQAAGRAQQNQRQGGGARPRASRKVSMLGKGASVKLLTKVLTVSQLCARIARHVAFAVDAEAGAFAARDEGAGASRDDEEEGAAQRQPSLQDGESDDFQDARSGDGEPSEPAGSGELSQVDAPSQVAVGLAGAVHGGLEEVDAPSQIMIGQGRASALAGQPANAAGILSSKEQGLLAVQAMLRALWHLPCENRIKEPYWRLAVNGVPGAGGADLCLSAECACGEVCLSPRDTATEEERERVGARLLRLHAFWNCPVAAAVVQEVRAGLPAGTPLSRSHLWLGQPPAGAITRAVWRVVCMAAVAAMEKGRRCLLCMYHVREAQRAAVAVRPQGLRQLTLYEAFHIAPPAAADDAAGDDQVLDPVLTAKRCAIKEFWALLQLFVDTLPQVTQRPARAHAAGQQQGDQQQRGIRAWAGSELIGVTHPFIRRAGPDAPPRFEVVLPAQLAAEAVAQPAPAAGQAIGGTQGE